MALWDAETQKLKFWVRGGNIQSTLGNIQSSLGNIQSPLGNIQSSLGNKQSSLGNIQSSLGNIQSSLGNSGLERRSYERSNQANWANGTFVGIDEFRRN
jgi:phage-related protein